MRAPAIEVSGLRKRFGDFVAVDGISFSVARGEIFGLLGPNGAGKSTIIRMLCGILSPTEGTGVVAGHSISREPEEVRARIGYMSQKFSLYLDLTVAENLEFYGGIYGVAPEPLRERIAWALKMAGLGEQRERLTGELSAGWRQRLALGCALLHEPKVVFLDEPTAGVDPISRRQFWAVIYDLASAGVTCLVTTHHLDEAERCGRVGLMFDGKLIALDSPERLKSAPEVGAMLEIECDQPGQALAVLQRSETVRFARLHGALIHAAVRQTEGAIEAIGSALGAHGLSMLGAEIVKPTLEDVFVSLIREAEGAQSGAST